MLIAALLLLLPFRDKNSHTCIFKHLSFSKNCQDNNIVMFLASKLLIMLLLSTLYHLKIKESFHIERLKPELNKQVDHVSLAFHF